MNIVLAHSPGPWNLVGHDEHGRPTQLEVAASLRIHGLGSGVPLTVGSVPLTFRPQRCGSHRQGVRFDRFNEIDLANARALAASAELISAIAGLLINVPIDYQAAAQVRAHDDAGLALVSAGWDGSV